VRSNKVYTVARREFLDIVANKNTVIAGLLFAGWFSWLHGFGVTVKETDNMVELFNGCLIYLTPMVGVFVAYIYSGQAFLFEKTEGIIETLLCAPLNLRALWLGKSIGVAFPAWLATLIFTAGFTLLVRHYTEVALVPALYVVFHVLVIVPLFIVAAVGIMGFWQLVLGMRENQIVNLVVFLGLFVGLSFSGHIMQLGLVTSWQLIGILLGVAILFLVFTWWLGRFLNKDRIVRSIP